MDIRTVFGRNLRRYRLAASLSQEAVAERMGVDRAHISAMERGQQNITLLTLWQVSQAVDCRPMNLMDEDGAGRGQGPARGAKAPRKRRTKL
jgi:transcriptional regulator with XRE-family HTH domain